MGGLRRECWASIGQVWTRHLAPAAPASRPSLPTQFHDCSCHADSALQFVPGSVGGGGWSAVKGQFTRGEWGASGALHGGGAGLASARSIAQLPARPAAHRPSGSHDPAMTHQLTDLTGRPAVRLCPARISNVVLRGNQSH